MIYTTRSQPLSTEAFDAKPERIGNSLSYRSAYPGETEPTDRPLAVVFGWLLSKARHIHKYGDYYLSKDFDVLHVKITPDQMLWPKKTHVVIDQIMELLQDKRHASQPLLVHGFSVGAYLYGEMLASIHKQGESGMQVGERIMGQIFDSGVDYYGVPEGFSKAVTKIEPLQKAMTSFLHMYLKVMYNHVTCHYESSSEQIHANHLRVPSLVLYSPADPVASIKTVKLIMKKWEDKGVDVYSKSFPSSPHVSHFHHYPIEYIQQLNMFLEKLNLIKPQQQIIHNQNT